MEKTTLNFANFDLDIETVCSVEPAISNQPDTDEYTGLTLATTAFI